MKTSNKPKNKLNKIREDNVYFPTTNEPEELQYIDTYWIE